MSMELQILGWTLVLALGQIFLSAAVLSSDFGLIYNISARDTAPPPMSMLGGRLRRAQSNLFETLPLFAAGILIAHVAGRENGMTALGAELFLGARIAYVPLYAAGIPILRTLAFLTSVVGLVLVLVAILHPA